MAYQEEGLDISSVWYLGGEAVVTETVYGLGWLLLGVIGGWGKQ